MAVKYQMRALRTTPSSPGVTGYTGYVYWVSENTPDQDGSVWESETPYPGEPTRHKGDLSEISINRSYQLIFTSDPYSFGTIKLTRDLGGSSGAPNVVGLQGRDISSAAPTSGQFLVWNGTNSRWEPNTPSGIILGGDLAGAPSSATVTKIQGRDISSAAPTSGQFLVWNGTNSRWEPGASAAINLGGDLSGSPSSATVTKIQGSSVSSTPPSLYSQVLIWDTTKWVPSLSVQLNSVSSATVTSETNVSKKLIVNDSAKFSSGSIFRHLNLDLMATDYTEDDANTFARWRLNGFLLDGGSNNYVTATGTHNPAYTGSVPPSSLWQKNTASSSDTWFYGKCITFTDGYMKGNNSPSIIPPSATNGITVSAWIRIDDLSQSTSQEIFSIKNSSFADLISLKRTGYASWSATFATGSTGSSSISVSNEDSNGGLIKQGKWTLISATFSRSAGTSYVKTYVDGNFVEESTGADQLYFDVNITPFINLGEYYVGYAGTVSGSISIAEVRLEDVERSSSYFKDYYERVFNPIYSGGDVLIKGKLRAEGGIYGDLNIKGPLTNADTSKFHKNVTIENDLSSTTDFMTDDSYTFARWSFNSTNLCTGVAGGKLKIKQSGLGVVLVPANETNSWFYGNSKKFTLDSYLYSDPTNIVPYGDEITISSWVFISDLSSSKSQEIFKLKNSSTDIIKIARSGSSSGSWRVTVNMGGSSIVINNDISNGGLIPQSKWALISVTVSKVSGTYYIKTYLNGKYLAQDTSTNPIYDSTANNTNVYYFGYDTSSSSQGLALAEARVETTARSESYLKSYYDRVINIFYVNGSANISGNLSAGQVSLTATDTTVSSVQSNSLYALNIPKAFAAFIYNSTASGSGTDPNGLVRTNISMKNSFNISAAAYVVSATPYFEFTFANPISNIVLVTGMDYSTDPTKTSWLPKYEAVNDSTIRIYCIDMSNGHIKDPALSEQMHFIAFGSN